MKVAIFTGKLSGGGAERVAVNLANYYATQYQSSEVYLITLACSPDDHELIDKSVRVINLNVRGRYAVTKLRNALCSIEPEVLLSTLRDINVIAAVATVGLSIKLVFREANTLDRLKHQGGLKSNLFMMMMRVAYRRASFVICNSQDTRKDLIQSRIIVEHQASKCKVISNPIILPADVSHFGRNPVPPHRWLGSDYFVFVTAGRLTYQKNQSLLLHAFSQVRDCIANSRLLILGRGELEDELRDEVKRLGLTDVVDFTGFVDPYPYYLYANAFVLTSRWEGFGNVLVEAMSCGLPVISTDCPGGPREITGGGRFGLLVDNYDVEKLARAMQSVVVENLSTLIDLQGIDSHLSNFRVEVIAEEYKSIIDAA